MPTGGEDWSTAPVVNIWEQDGDWTETSPIASSAGGSRPHWSRWWQLENGETDDFYGLLDVDTLDSDSGGDTFINVFDAGLDLITFSDDADGSTLLSHASLTTKPGETYFVQVGTYDTDPSPLTEFVVRFQWSQRGSVIIAASDVVSPAWNGSNFVVDGDWYLDAHTQLAAGDQVVAIAAGIPLMYFLGGGGWDFLDYQPGERCQGSVAAKTVGTNEADNAGDFVFDAGDPVNLTVAVLRGWGGYELLGTSRSGHEGDTQSPTTVTFATGGGEGDFLVFAAATRDETSAASLDIGTVLDSSTSGAVHGYAWTDQPGGPVGDATLSLPERSGHYAAGLALWAWAWGPWVDQPAADYRADPGDEEGGGIVEKVQTYSEVVSVAPFTPPLDGDMLNRMTSLTAFEGPWAGPAPVATYGSIIGPTGGRTIYGRRGFFIAGSWLKDDNTEAWYAGGIGTPPLDASPDYQSFEGSDPTMSIAPRKTIVGIDVEFWDASANELNLDETVRPEVQVDGVWSTILVPTVGTYDDDARALVDWDSSADIGDTVLYRRPVYAGIGIASFDDFGINVDAAVEEWATGKVTILCVVVGPTGTGPEDHPQIFSFADMTSGNEVSLGAHIVPRRWVYKMQGVRERYAYRHAPDFIITSATIPPRLVYPRTDSLGLGIGRVYPPPNTQQHGRQTGSSSPL